jgi:arylsulfatase A-like enzyme
VRINHEASVGKRMSMLEKWISRIAASVQGRRSTSERRSARPNIVWICADDFTPDVCGAYGNRVVRTPNLDRLASEGMRFDRAFCTCPLSTPSRQSFWTGRYPRSIGVTLSRTPLPDDEVTLPDILRRSGYEVAAFGKTHYYWPRRHEFDICVDWAEYVAWLSSKGGLSFPVSSAVLGTWRPFHDPARVWLNSDCLPYAETDADMLGTFLASRAAQHLEGKRTRPFFFYVSFYETHSPFWFPVEYRGRHDPRSFRVPSVGPEDKSRLPPVFRELTEADKQGIMAAYATSAEFLDKNVGLVLGALDRSGHAEDTLVIFTSDHGYLLGQHGRFEKHCCYEPAVRAALLMRFPEWIRPGQATSALVELIDLVPTILELCGESAPGNLHGRSLTSLLRDQTSVHREHVIAEYADNEEAMIRTERWKLIYCAGSRRRRDGYALEEPAGEPSVQLYDLDNDPDETINLAGQAKHSGFVEQLTNVLAEHLMRTAREPRIPRTKDIRLILGHCLTPRDVAL